MIPPPMNPNRPGDPFCTPHPRDAETDSSDETKVTNPLSMYRKMEKLDRMLIRMVDPISQIPDIKSKVEHIGERVTRVEEKLKTTKEKVDTFDKPHDCFQIDTIDKHDGAILSIKKEREEDTVRLASTCSTLSAVLDDVHEIKQNDRDVKAAKSGFRTWFIGLAAGFLVTAFSAVWFMAGISSDIQIESMARQHQFEQVEQVLTKVSSQANNAPVVQQIERLKQSVEISSQDTESFNKLCDGMAANEKGMMRVFLSKRGKTVPVSCLE